MLTIAGWIVVGTMAVLVASQIAGWSNSRMVIILQALTPYLFGLTLLVAVAALVGQVWILGAAAAALAVALCPLGRPLLSPAPQPPPLDQAVQVKVFHGNLLCDNGGTAELPAMLGRLGVDVLAFTEYTAVHAALLVDSPLAHGYPHRIEHTEGRAGGSAIWSRYPLTEVTAPPSRNRSSAAVVGAPQPLTLLVVHPPSPIMSLGGWNRELAALSARPRARA